MPALPWTKGTHKPAAGDQLHVLTSRLPLRSYADVPRFLYWTMRIRSQLQSAPGCIGFALDAKLITKTFWTLSAWSDKEAMDSFAHSGTHAKMLADMKGRIGNPSFVDSTATTQDIPLSWPDARARIQKLLP
ncbi:hypothetical protein ACFXG4_10655 [Nocardia sp. NPDC059246]|uniref:hypothetical protein n=1 Tax=unclassified Nocardia TaxID=2637762 RepID=UPI00367F915B